MVYMQLWTALGNPSLHPCPTLDTLEAVMPLISLRHFSILEETNSNRKTNLLYALNSAL